MHGVAIRHLVRRLEIGVDRFGEFADLLVGIGQVVVGLAQGRVQVEGAAVIFDRAQQMTFRPQNDPEIAVGIGEVVIDQQRLLIAARRGGDLAGLFQDETEGVQGIGRSRIDEDRLGGIRHGVGEVAALQHERAHQIEGVDLAWIGGEGAIVEILGRIQVPELMGSDRLDHHGWSRRLSTRRSHTFSLPDKLDRITLKSAEQLVKAPAAARTLG